MNVYKENQRLSCVCVCAALARAISVEAFIHEYILYTHSVDMARYHISLSIYIYNIHDTFV